MHLQTWLSLLACAGSALTAGLIWSRDPSAPANRQLALIGACTCFWAMCEVAWNTTADPAVALFFVKLSAVGWIWLGPLCVKAFLAMTEEREPWAERVAQWGCAIAAAVLVAGFATDGLHRDVVRTSWGWGYRFGPLFSVYYALTLWGFGIGFGLAARAFRRYASPAERSQGAVVLVAVGAPLVVGSLTDGVLPALGHQPPRLATASLTFMGAAIAWSYFRFGYSLLAPGRFAPEILESLAEGVLLVRPGGVIRIANPGMGRLVGLPPAALQGRRIDEVLPFVPLDPEGEMDELEGELAAAGDRRIPVSVSLSRLRDRRGLPLGLVLIVHDLRELVALRHRLVTSGRLAAVGQLAAGIAHEINNPIAYVRSNLGVLREHWAAVGKELREDERGAQLGELLAEGEELIAESLEGVDRAAAIVRDVKGFSHAGEGPRQAVDLAPLLDRVLRIAEPQLRGRARVETDYADTPPIPCAPQELQQVFLNLVLNAAQAVAPEGTIAVQTRLEPDAVVVRVADDGCGIAPELAERIFDPFFTTKPVGEGTGLGLAISYQIVRNHGGEISVESAPRRGSCFTVRLPRGDLAG
jgi:signal transduction histidine kinase